jgi:hypothetical protein
MYKKFAVVPLIALGLVMLANSPIKAEWVTLVPWGSSNLRYKTFSTYSEIPGEVFTLEFDDSGWDLGTAPFGKADTLCDVNIATPIADAAIVIRFWLNLPEQNYIPGWNQVLSVYMRTVHNSYLYVNGGGIGSSGGNWSCPFREVALGIWDYNLIVGANLIVMGGESTAPWNYFDFKIELDSSTVPTELSTWGRIKALYGE